MENKMELSIECYLLNLSGTKTYGYIEDKAAKKEQEHH